MDIALHRFGRSWCTTGRNRRARAREMRLEEDVPAPSITLSRCSRMSASSFCDADTRAVARLMAPPEFSQRRRSRDNDLGAWIFVKAPGYVRRPSSATVVSQGGPVLVTSDTVNCEPDHIPKIRGRRK